ncbi:LAME_0G09472g1_1 [Lachancea meyersii CBS 8951]|uniref:LAME_0G09472g1_1 n=1 Tax=Lachancea meyersii CBS 8951 TaxID=1266667 RepID=A0A1G4K8L8_9SACH|nr:LAME_0G09472g1_1 [Lachancea meyersii CBS 8951]
MRSTRRTSNASTTPVETVSKWKIPHYYRKANTSAVGLAQGEPTHSGAANGSANGSSKDHGNINIMTTPQHVQMEGSGRRSAKAKTRKGEMVFVNYTVKDSDTQEPGLQVQQQQQQEQSANITNNKKKSSKSRMLKIFSAVHGSGNHHSSHSGHPHSSQASQASQTSLAPLDTTSGAFERSSASTPSSQVTKRSYSSFLKYGGIRGSASTITSPTEEVVPTSADRRMGLNRSLSSNVALVNNNGKASLTLGASAASCSEPSFMARHSPSKERSNPYLSQSQSQTTHFDHHYADQYNDYSVYPAAKTRPHSSSLHSSFSPRLGDENDASIAFSKMFTRKRANTGGSMSSLVSSATSNNHPGLQRNMSNNSISSLAHKYSPIRTASPGKPASLRRSNSHRFSRDFSSFHSNQNYAADLNIGMDSFLDTQAKQQRHTHKKKQESFSELRGPSTVSSLSSASTPCFFDTGHLNIGVGHERQNSVLLSLDRESSLENEILEENEETSYSPHEASALEGVSKTALEGTEERDFDAASFPNTSRSSVTMFSSMVNSHSTLESTVPSTKSSAQNDVQLSNIPHRFGIDTHNNQRHTSLNFQDAQNDNFLNLYMELDLGCAVESLTADEQERHALPENDMSYSNALFQGDASTIHSVMNNSPATVTNQAGNNARIEAAEDTSHHEQIPYTNFSSRIMHDIDQIANSITNGEGHGGLTNEWNNSHL